MRDFVSIDRARQFLSGRRAFVVAVGELPAFAPRGFGRKLVLSALNECPLRLDNLWHAGLLVMLAQYCTSLRLPSLTRACQKLGRRVRKSNQATFRSQRQLSLWGS